MNRDRSFTSTVTVLLGLFVMLLLLNVAGALGPFKSTAGFLLKPVAGVFNLGSDEASETEALKERVSELTAEVAAREEAKLENDRLREQLNFAKTNNYKLASGRVISQDPANYQQFLTIDQGSGAGINKGMAVVSGGVLVGRIIETTPNTAKVFLITDFNSAVPVLAQQTRAAGLVRGTRGFGLALEMVQQTDQLNTGDTVLTSGFGGEYPPGLVVGTLGEIKRRDTDVFQSADITPSADFRKLERVFVIIGTP